VCCPVCTSGRIYYVAESLGVFPHPHTNNNLSDLRHPRYRVRRDRNSTMSAEEAPPSRKPGPDHHGMAAKPGLLSARSAAAARGKESLKRQFTSRGLRQIPGPNFTLEIGVEMPPPNVTNPHLEAARGRPEPKTKPVSRCGLVIHGRTRRLLGL
jgi:hypothetical protein